MAVLALIVPLGGGHMPVNPGYGVPAPPSGGGAPVYPSHPIALPPVYPSQGLPVYPSQGPVLPPVERELPKPGVAGLPVPMHRSRRPLLGIWGPGQCLRACGQPLPAVGPGAAAVPVPVVRSPTPLAAVSSSSGIRCSASSGSRWAASLRSTPTRCRARTKASLLRPNPKAAPPPRRAKAPIEPRGVVTFYPRGRAARSPALEPVPDVRTRFTSAHVQPVRSNARSRA